MKTFILGVAATLALVIPTKAVLIGEFTFTGNVDASSIASGFSFTPVFTSQVSGTAGATTYVTGLGNGTGWSTGDYIQFIVTPSEGIQLDVASVTFNMVASTAFSAASVQFDYGTGFTPASPSTFSVTTTPTAQVVTFSMPAVSAPVGIRFYGGAGDTDQSITFDNISIDGDITAVPEPANVALAIFGFTFAGIGLGRKFLKKKA